MFSVFLRDHSSYRYSQLSNDDDILEEVHGYDRVRKGVKEYRDESDIESVLFNCYYYLFYALFCKVNVKQQLELISMPHSST